jgi:phosphate transport system substrate-binding protein
MEIFVPRTALRIAGLFVALFAAVPAMASGTLTLRDRLVMVGTSSTEAVSRMLVARFADAASVPAPHLEIAHTGQAFEAFCAGVGPETPDLALVSRRMPRAMLEHCRANGVNEIVELRLGFGAVVLAARRGDAFPVLTSRNVYEALAAELSEEGQGFSPNHATLWSQVDPSLPRREIRVLVPEPGSAMRALMEDLILEAGCRNVRSMRLIFEASYRRSKCITLRLDQRAIPVAHDDMVGTFLVAPRGTIAVLSFDQLLRTGGVLVPLRLDGVLPDAAGISRLDYQQAQTMFLYAKRQHAQNREGVGVVRGLRLALLEAASEAASGPGGYLITAGLVPLPPADRSEQRRVADRLSLRTR